MFWPVAVPPSVSEPSSAALSAILRLDRLLGRSIPIDSIDAALAEGAKARSEIRKAMKALRQARQVARSERDAAVRAAARYARDEDRLTAQREAQITGERMAASMEARAA